MLAGCEQSRDNLVLGEDCIWERTVAILVVHKSVIHTLES